MKYVAFGIDDNPLYSFFAPLTAQAWFSMGYRVIVLRVQGLETPVSELVLSELLSADRAVNLVDLDPPPAGHRSSTVAQVARLYAWAATGLSGDDYVLTSDADMWPIDRAWYERGEAPAGWLSLLYANNRTRFPMCYAGAHVATWREIMAATGPPDPKGYAGYDDRHVQAQIDHHLRVHIGPGGAASDAWQHDEEFMTGRFHAWTGYPGNCLFVDRKPGEPPGDRIDRSQWPLVIGRGRIDAHLLRPGHSDRNWERLAPLFRQLCPGFGDWAERYRNEFVKAMRIS